MNEFPAQWKQYSARFAALQPREKNLVTGAVAVAILFIGHALVIEPALMRKAAAEKLATQYRTDLSILGPQVDVLKAQLKDPDAPLRKGIADVRRQMADLDRQLGGFDKVLVAPDKVPALLQSLLTRHRGLELVSLKTLPPEPVIRHEDSQAGKPSSAAGVVKPAPATETANIYRHGIEIKVAGSYQDLLAYVGEVEQAPQRLLMGSLQLDANRYPRVELTLLVYSLSLDRTWLVV